MENFNLLSSSLFINPELVYEKIVEDNIFFPAHYLTLGKNLRNVHALVAMKCCWEYFERQEDYEKIIPIQEQINVFFQNQTPTNIYTNVEDMSILPLAPKSIKEAINKIKEDLKFSGKLADPNFRRFNTIDININIAKNYDYYYTPIIYDFVMVELFSKENKIIAEFRNRGVYEIEHMVFLLIKEAITSV